MLQNSIEVWRHCLCRQEILQIMWGRLGKKLHSSSWDFGKNSLVLSVMRWMNPSSKKLKIFLKYIYLFATVWTTAENNDWNNYFSWHSLIKYADIYVSFKKQGIFLWYGSILNDIYLICHSFLCFSLPLMSRLPGWTVSAIPSPRLQHSHGVL